MRSALQYKSQDDQANIRSRQGRRSRRRGSEAERELFSLLSEYLGIVCQRNLVQTREGGADCIDIPGLAIEVKRRAKWPAESELGDMWCQACHQAVLRDAHPMLWVRADRGKWWAAIDISCLDDSAFPNYGKYFCLMRFEPAVQWIRNLLGDDRPLRGKS